MGEVVVILRVMPEDTEVNLAELEKRIREKVKVFAVEREPIAFGLEALRIATVVEDKEGGTEPLEREISSIPGVASVEVIGLSRIFL
ncbi:MAG: elongation factor 1-beta [Candidatus Hadarchaeales archaeon]